MGKRIYYKLFTTELKSLGLRKKPHILTYIPGEWYFLDKYNIKEGISDFGGIWVCKNLSNARKLTKYMLNKYNQVTITYSVYIDQILYENSYRVKTNGIYLKEEIQKGLILKKY